MWKKTKVELLFGTKNQEPLAKSRHLQNYMLNAFLSHLYTVEGKEKLSKGILKLPCLAAGL